MNQNSSMRSFFHSMFFAYIPNDDIIGIDLYEKCAKSAKQITRKKNPTNSTLEKEIESYHLLREKLSPHLISFDSFPDTIKTAELDYTYTSQDEKKSKSRWVIILTLLLLCISFSINLNSIFSLLLMVGIIVSGIIAYIFISNKEEKKKIESSPLAADYLCVSLSNLSIPSYLSISSTKKDYNANSHIIPTFTMANNFPYYIPQKDAQGKLLYEKLKASCEKLKYKQFKSDIDRSKEINTYTSLFRQLEPIWLTFSQLPSETQKEVTFEEIEIIKRYQKRGKTIWIPFIFVLMIGLFLIGVAKLSSIPMFWADILPGISALLIIFDCLFWLFAPSIFENKALRAMQPLKPYILVEKEMVLSKHVTQKSATSSSDFETIFRDFFQ